MSRCIEIERDGAGQAVRLWFSAEAPSKGVTPAVACGVGLPRCVCGRPVTGKGRYCCRRCKDTAYNAAHPVKRQQPEQPRLDFTPAASELAHALKGRETKAQRIVARLRLGPASTWELVKVGGSRFGARLNELKAAGMTWDREDHADHSVYTMTREPRP